MAPFRPMTAEAFRAFIASGWAPRETTPAPRADVADRAAGRRAALAGEFPGERLVIPAGGLKVRSNDTDYPYRPHTAFAHLTGLGAATEPDSVLVLDDGRATLYFRPLAPRDSTEFYADMRYGEFWVGPRPTIEEIESRYGLAAAHLDDLPGALAKDADPARLRVVRPADPAVARLVDKLRVDGPAVLPGADDDLDRHLSEMRLIKDDWEIGEMRAAIAATHRGFEAIIAALPEAIANGRGERWIEGVFGLHARHQGNGIGYDSICAAGDHANTIHWIRNTGEIRPDDLILIDAGVERDSLFTADITRTLPAGGRFSGPQREIYQAVLEAQEAGLAAVRPGNRFRDIHTAATRVIAERVHGWGLLPAGVTVDQTLDPESGGWHRRWMVHGTSHHLGMDVHDCARLRREDYLDGDLRPGMILTVEPGLYFKADDLLAPEEFRGIGVRIEDNVLVTADGHENLSAAMPRTAADVEAWLSSASG
ncbi:aminopeptidase P family protein [Actinoplanes flavus]|uniref:Xaa-Pro aminopeptidase n=1 Tax=Actinoplanes flavus TaxID=2820290 RepID=A0ABS3UXS0_9ACTN|nr:aminopeptidase P family protein [Actinoplanes flavus]